MKMGDDHVGSEWDYVLDSLLIQIETGRLSDFVYTDEFSTTATILESASDLLNVDLRNWMAVRGKKAKERSAEISEKHRNAGNKAFQQRQFDVAAAYYTEAILTAPKDSVVLALAHANRASTCTRPNAFAETGYHDCVLALKFNYPPEKRNKLLERKFHLAAQLHSKQFMGDTLMEMEELVRSGAFTAEQLKLPARRKQCHQADESRAPASIFDDYLDPATTPANFSYTKLEEQYDAPVGRYVVAGETILENQPIFRERAFAFVPVHDYMQESERSFSCENCAKTNCLPFPCYECCRAFYCSPPCMDRHRHIHQLECAGYKMNLWRSIGIAHLSFRTFVVGVQDALERLSGDVQRSSAADMVDKLLAVKDEQFTYASVLRLVTNFDKMSARDTLSYALTAYMLAVYLDEYTTLRDKFAHLMESSMDWHVLSRVLIMKHIGQLVSNGHAITDFELRPPTQTNGGYRHECDKIPAQHLYSVVSCGRMFTAIFPRISILNHSCDPNIRNTFNGPFLCVYATRDIMAGDEIFNCYGPHYKIMSRSERQSVLQQQYCFDCKCDKCASDDKAWKKYYEYVCTKDNCDSRRIIDVEHQNWWHHLDDPRNIESVFCKFYCNECDTDLITPKLLGVCRMIDEQPVLDPSQALACWQNASPALGEYNEFRAVLAQGILRRCNVQGINHSNVAQIAQLAVDNLVLTSDRYGCLSTEFVMATTYALLVLERVCVLEKQCSPGEFGEKAACIRNMFDLRSIERSFTILSPLMRQIFQHALYEVIDPKQRNIVAC